MERIKPQDNKCSEAAWRECLFVMNSQPERVVIKIEAVTEVVMCHYQLTGIKVDLEVKSSGTKYITVNKAALFGLVQEHGAICGRTK